MSDKKEHVFSLGQIEFDMKEAHDVEDTDNVPVLATRDLVLYPEVTFPISLGREESIKTAEYSEKTHNPIAIVSQTDPAADIKPVPEGLYHLGVLGIVMKIFDIPNGPKTAIVRCTNKIEIIGPGKEDRCAKINILPDDILESEKRANVIAEEIRNTAHEIMSTMGSGDNAGEFPFDIDSIHDPALLINMLAAHTPCDTDAKIRMLGYSVIEERGLMLLKELAKSAEFAKLTAEIREHTKYSLTENQRTQFLQHQMELIRQEIYGSDDDDVAKMRQRADKIPLPTIVKEVFDRELSKLSRLNPQSPDYSVQYSYLDLLISLPWGEPERVSTSFENAENVLNADHYGLEKVKERILEQLAVMMNTPEAHSPIICLVGAPGVGKTSLGQSIAKALCRKYQRVSLGGLHDEAELRGHRRTYIGAMPGRIIDAIRRAGSVNPVILLDEIDKIGHDGKSDPSAALLEVLDPEQNCHFHDNYVDVDYDLSNVLFIATANTLSTLSQPLLDRMEIIDISGYLQEEKIEIAKRHLIPRVLSNNGYTSKQISFNDDTINAIIEGYTSESGVRQLEKKIATIVRKLVLKKMRGKRTYRTIKPHHLRELLGTNPHIRDRYEGNDYAGVVTGLAWTAAGGEILYVESSLARSKNDKLTVTGNLGDVMKESAAIALQYVKAHSALYDIPDTVFDNYALHIHVPEGAIPKDGPSAGITMVTSIISAMTQRRVRQRIAMTGEITLRGKVLPVGGVKEKILAAKRAGIDTIILSADNKRDIDEIPAQYLHGMSFKFINDITEVIEFALLKEKVNNPSDFK